MVKNQGHVVMFVHIPKTAGTSFRTVLGQQFGPGRVFSLYTFGEHRQRVDALARLFVERPARIRLIQGHVGYGLHEHVPVDLRYITMLRDPIKRVLSMYRHIRRDPTHQLHAAVTRMSIGDYLDSGVDESAHNSQTRFASGVKLEQELAGQDDQIGYGAHGPEEMLARARANVTDGFVFTGITERFDASLLLMKRLLGFGSVYYSRLNYRKGEDLRPTDNEIDLVARHNELDMDLYEHASRELDRSLAKFVPDLQDDLARFRRTNRIVGPLVAYPTRLVHKAYERAFVLTRKETHLGARRRED